jgi:hypothetical protein
MLPVEKVHRMAVLQAITAVQENRRGPLINVRGMTCISCNSVFSTTLSLSDAAISFLQQYLLRLKAGAKKTGIGRLLLE